MSRAFVINGEALVSVMGGAHLSGGITGHMSGQGQLGLSIGEIRVTPNPNYRDIKTPDFGPDVPVDVMWNLMDANISMTLIHYDKPMLDVVIAESAGGLQRDPDTPTQYLPPGFLAPAGTLMGGGKQLYASGCHYLGLCLEGPNVSGGPWYFPASYLSTPRPWEYPLGTDATAVVLNWRAIPYQYLTQSSGSASEFVSRRVPLFTRNPFNTTTDFPIPLLNPLPT